VSSQVLLPCQHRVGAALGAGQALGARLAARASLLTVPAVWLLLAAFLLERHSQDLLLWLFTKVRSSWNI